MKLSFLGAAREVTGSCFLVEVSNKLILVDCGMQQGSDEKDNQNLPLDAKKIDYVFLTHAHIDHSGRLPLLYKLGFRGKVYTTKATYELSKIMLKDSAHIQKMDAEFLNRKYERAGKQLVQPLYDLKDAEGILNNYETVDYNTKIDIDENISAEFVDAGHLLGSASIKLFLTENNIKRKIIFSGDIGNLDQPIINDYSKVADADFVLMETTYGNRLHDKREDVISKLAKIIDSTMSQKGTVVIPSFAVGRTQELLYYLRIIKEKKLVKSLPDFKVVLDSPLAVEATTIYNNCKQYYDLEAKKIIKKGKDLLTFPNLHLSVTTEESKALNNKEPKVIISASGMCDAGRIRHHLKHNLWKPNSTIIFVGYQAEGTLGRLLLEGRKKVKIFREEIFVKAKIETIQGMSAHADRNMLFDWIKNVKVNNKVFLVHGEVPAQASFKSYCNEYLDKDIEVPEYLDSYNLETGEKLEADKFVVAPKLSSSKTYQSTYAEAKKLIEILEQAKGIANNDLRQAKDFITEAINKILY